MSAYGAALRESGLFKEVVVHEPTLINTDMARTAFPTERTGETDWSTVQTPEVYAEQLFPEQFFIDR